MPETDRSSSPVLGQADLDLHVVKDSLMIELMRTDAVDGQAVVSIEVEVRGLSSSTDSVNTRMSTRTTMKSVSRSCWFLCSSFRICGLSGGVLCASRRLHGLQEAHITRRVVVSSPPEEGSPSQVPIALVSTLHCFCGESALVGILPGAVAEQGELEMVENEGSLAAWE